MTVKSAIPVGLLMERRVARVRRWSQPQWRVAGVVAGEDVGREQRRFTLVDETDERRQYLFSGLELELFKDGCESYWYNLMSDAPCLFVVCFAQDDDDERLQDDKGRALEVLPAVVTASQDEAGAHLESDDQVHSVPMPIKIHESVERFVVEHYVPEQKKKRKRRNWSGTESRDNEGA